MEIAARLVLDGDGFLPRACPHCRGEFKWRHDARQPPTAYFCPLCGRSAAPDQWFTDDQAEHVRDLAARAAAQRVARSGRAGGGSSRVRIEFVVEPARPGEAPAGAAAATVVAAAPCHPQEPVKVAPESGAALHCLVCGERSER
ncbi:MAG: hypothetical protein ACT4QF_19775 [Sporichthyaceae bacterium]